MVFIARWSPDQCGRHVNFGYFPRYELLSSLIFGKVQTDGRTESDAYEPTMQLAQVGSIKTEVSFFFIVRHISDNLHRHYRKGKKNCSVFGMYM